MIKSQISNKSTKLSVLLNNELIARLIPCCKMIFRGISTKTSNDILNYVGKINTLLGDLSESDFKPYHIFPLLKLSQLYASCLTHDKHSVTTEEHVGQLQKLIQYANQFIKITSGTSHRPNQHNYLTWAGTIHSKLLNDRNDPFFVFETLLFIDAELIYFEGGSDNKLDLCKNLLSQISNTLTKLKIHEITSDHLTRCLIINHETIQVLSDYQQDQNEVTNRYFDIYKLLAQMNKTLLQELSLDQKLMTNSNQPIYKTLEHFLVDCYFKLSRDSLALLNNDDEANCYFNKMADELELTRQKYKSLPSALDETEITEIERYMVLEIDLLLKADSHGSKKHEIDQANNDLIHFYHAFKTKPMWGIDLKCITIFGKMVNYYLDRIYYIQAYYQLNLIENCLDTFESKLNNNHRKGTYIKDSVGLYQFINDVKKSNLAIKKDLQSALNRYYVEILKQTALFSIMQSDAESLLIKPLPNKIHFFKHNYDNIFKLFKNKGIEISRNRDKKCFRLDSLSRHGPNELMSKLMDIYEKLGQLAFKNIQVEIQYFIKQISLEKNRLFEIRCEERPLIEKPIKPCTSPSKEPLELKEQLKRGFYATVIKEPSTKLLNKDAPQRLFFPKNMSMGLPKTGNTPPTTQIVIPETLIDGTDTYGIFCMTKTTECFNPNRTKKI